MKFLGWGLISVSGAAVLYAWGDWVFRVATGYYEGGEWSTALLIGAMFTLFALIPLLSGVLLVRRAGRRTGSGAAVHLDKVDWAAVVVMGFGVALLPVSAARAAAVIVAGLGLFAWRSWRGQHVK
jgi:hypothetical protein